MSTTQNLSAGDSRMDSVVTGRRVLGHGRQKGNRQIKVNGLYCLPQESSQTVPRNPKDSTRIPRRLLVVCSNPIPTAGHSPQHARGMMYSLIHNFMYNLDPFVNIFIAYFVWVCVEIIDAQERAIERDLESLKQEQRYWEWFDIKHYRLRQV